MLSHFYTVNVIVTNRSNASFTESLGGAISNAPVEYVLDYLFHERLSIVPEEIFTTDNTNCRPQFSCISKDASVDWCASSAVSVEPFVVCNSYGVCEIETASTSIASLTAGAIKQLVEIVAKLESGD